jgi:hypothetical protein
MAVNERGPELPPSRRPLSDFDELGGMALLLPVPPGAL